jgi:aspartate 1-decarboxylase
MQVTVLKCKIHRATVTRSDLDYEGSIEVDAGLMETAGLIPHELVHVWNVTNGERFQTYVVPGEPGSGAICINGAAAHKARVGDLVIIAAFAAMEEAAARKWQPTLVFVDAKNRPVALSEKRRQQKLRVC